MPSSPLAAAISRAPGHQHALLELAGPMLPGTEVARLFDMTLADVEQHRGKGQLLAVRIDSAWRFPLFQFRGAGLLPGMQELLTALEGSDPWTVLDHLLAEDSAFGGQSLLDLMRAGDRDAIERILRQLNGDGYA